MARVTRTDLAARIDHTLLRPEATETDVARLCVEAISLGVPAVCVSPPMVRAAIRTIDGARLPVACVMGFPSGAHLTSVKASESRNAVADGAIEIDMVADLGASVRTCNQARADEGDSAGKNCDLDPSRLSPVERGLESEMRADGASGGPSAIFGRALASFRRLWQTARSFHPPSAPCRPRSRSFPACCRTFICPKAGSTIAFRVA